MKNRKLEVFTNREIEVLGMALTGMSINQMREKLLLSTVGVKWRLGKVYKKLSVKNRQHLLNKAYLNGLEYFCKNGLKHKVGYMITKEMSKNEK